jgi:hypothetical protein
MDIDKLNQKFNELIKNFNEKSMRKWLKQNTIEEELEIRSKRSEQLKTNNNALNYFEWRRKNGYKPYLDPVAIKDGELIKLNDLLDMYEDYYNSF